MNWQKEVEEFKAKMKVEAPSISASYIRFGFFGLVGGGKSTTAGILAVSITSEGTIGWIDGENRRSGYAIDQVAEMAAQHYQKPAQEFIDRIKVLHVDPPFNPLVGVAAMETLEEQGCKTIIVDLCSQLWDSEGGYLDMRESEIDKMAGSDEAKRNRVASSAAARVKPWTHGKFVSKVNSLKANVILVFQAKAKWNVKAKTVDEFVSPIQESGLTRTALAVGLVEQNDSGVGGFCKFQLPLGQGTKFTHLAILKALPQNGEQFGFQHGEAIMRWMNGHATNVTAKPSAKAEASPKKALWEATKHIHNGDPEALAAWLKKHDLLGEDEKLADLPLSQLTWMLKQLPNIL